MVDKETQKKVHEQLYQNLYVISLNYPTSKEFKLVFKHDMFVKNNKAAFHQVIYYLFDVLNPELTREIITAWPPYDIKSETKFRTEVLRYVIELNSKYSDADIPQITASHFISPGGFKFAWFAYKLSQFVMLEHLKKTDVNVLKHPKPSKYIHSNEATLNNLKSKIKVNEKEIYCILQEFDRYSSEIQKKASLIETRLSDCDKNIGELIHNRNEVRMEFEKKYPDFSSLENIRENLRKLTSKWDSLKNIHELFQHCNSLLLHLSDDKSLLRHDPSKFIIPFEVKYIVKDQENLDLIEFFHVLAILLQRKTIELPNPTDDFFSCNIQKLNETTEKCILLQNTIIESVQEFDAHLKTLKANVKVLKSQTLSSEFSVDLDSI